MPTFDLPSAGKHKFLSALATQSIVLSSALFRPNLAGKYSRYNISGFPALPIYSKTALLGDTIAASSTVLFVSHIRWSRSLASAVPFSIGTEEGYRASGLRCLRLSGDSAAIETPVFPYPMPSHFNPCRAHRLQMGLTSSHFNLFDLRTAR